VSDHCAQQQLCAGAIDGLSRNSVKLEGSQERLILRPRSAGNGMRAGQIQRAAQGAKKSPTPGRLGVVFGAVKVVSANAQRG
jgi:hypothetical protein